MFPPQKYQRTLELGQDGMSALRDRSDLFGQREPTDVHVTQSVPNETLSELPQGIKVEPGQHTTLSGGKVWDKNFPANVPIGTIHSLTLSEAGALRVEIADSNIVANNASVNVAAGMSLVDHVTSVGGQYQPEAIAWDQRYNKFNAVPLSVDQNSNLRVTLGTAPISVAFTDTKSVSCDGTTETNDAGVVGGEHQVKPKTWDDGTDGFGVPLSINNSSSLRTVDTNQSYGTTATIPESLAVVFPAGYNIQVQNGGFSGDLVLINYAINPLKDPVLVPLETSTAFGTPVAGLNYHQCQKDTCISGINLTYVATVSRVATIRFVVNLTAQPTVSATGVLNAGSVVLAQCLNLKKQYQYNQVFSTPVHLPTGAYIAVVGEGELTKGGYSASGQTAGTIMGHEAI
jgi:hypothetical protein